MTTLEKFQEILIDHLGVDAEQILPSSNLTQDLGADSLDHIEIIMAVEVEFEIDIPDEEAEKCQTVEECLAIIEKLVAAKG